MDNSRYVSEIKELVWGTEAPSNTTNPNRVLAKLGMAIFPYRISEIIEVDANGRFEYEIWGVKVPSELQSKEKIVQAKDYVLANAENATLVMRKYNPDSITYFFEGEEIV